jgi:DNA-binding NarL/FixJ family response regulator
MPQTTSENSQPIPTVIVSRPGIMQQSLRSALATCHEITVVATFGDGLTTLNHLAQFQPGIMVIDSNLLDEEIDALIGAVKAKQPAIRCLVFLKSTQQETQLLALGTDAVAHRDGSAQQLQAALARLALAARELQAGRNAGALRT